MTQNTSATINDILAYENGEMDEDEIVDFFQGLVNSGLCWALQGHYGRTATALIHAGYVSLPNKGGN